MREIQAGKKTHPMVEHFGEVHQGVQQEVLFRTVATFQTALQRQVWESVEIDSKTKSIGFHACLNHKTEWGSSKDPALVPRRSPLSKTLPRAQHKDQTAGNTDKRTRLPGVPETERQPKRRRTGPPTEPSTLEVGEGSPAAEGQEEQVSPGRSRWDQWQASSPESPPSPQPGGKRKRRRPRQSDSKPTDSGLQGPNILVLRDKNVSRPPNQERVGPGQGRSARPRRTRDREKATGPGTQPESTSQLSTSTPSGQTRNGTQYNRTSIEPRHITLEGS